jgi:hypothetical protein
MCAWLVCIPPPRRRVTRGETDPRAFYALWGGMPNLAHFFALGAIFTNIL